MLKLLQKELHPAVTKALCYLVAACLSLAYATSAYEHRHAVAPAITEARDATAEAVSDLLATQAKASDNSGEYHGGAPTQTWCEINPDCNGWRGPGAYTVLNFIAAKQQYQQQQQYARAPVKPVVIAKHHRPVTVAHAAPTPSLPASLLTFIRLSSN